mmetsp:Transcript_10515/g.16057  ORF Transcript_10515/g.16057 Transcript_10515/m.16057 type:complete len:368 (-) Transcript_10515:2106-3209(-)
MTSKTSSGQLIVPSSDKGIKVDSSIVAKAYREEIKVKVEALKKKGVEPPLLVGILANKDPAAKKYAEWTGKACRADGLRYDLRIVDDPINVEDTIIDANDDPRVHGIIVYYPIFGHEESFSGVSHDDYLRDTISYKCDVEGLCHLYRTNLYRNIRFFDYPRNTQKCLLPCTALSVMKLLEASPGCSDSSRPIGQKMRGKIVTVINRSEIVGRPLAAMLANDGAEVYSVDISSIYLFRNGRLEKCEDETTETCVRKSSIVITGVPTKAYRLPTHWIQPNSTVINVASFKNVDEDALLEVPGVVYIPQVGKVTVAMLERNLVRLFDNFHSSGSQEQTRKESSSWYGNALQLYTAAAVTFMLGMQLALRR